MFKKFIKRIPVHSRWRIALRTIPFVVIIVVLKSMVHYGGWDFLTLNSLFTVIISANIFLIGFLISGTLVDNKESEKLPGDLSASLETMADEGLIIYKNKKSREAKDFLIKLAQFNKSLIAWFHKEERTDSPMRELVSFNDDFLKMETQTQSNFIARLKGEYKLIRKMVNRIHVIR
jgi:hypothetical protein